MERISSKVHGRVPTFTERFVQVIERVSQSIWKERLRVRSCQVMLLKPFMSQRSNANAAEVQEKLPAGRERCY